MRKRALDNFRAPNKLVILGNRASSSRSAAISCRTRPRA